MVTEAERQWMWNEFAPEPRMRLNLGIRRRLAPLLDNDRRKIELANSILFSMPGSPIIYYGDEIGMGDNIWLPDRNGVRTAMQWTSGKNGGFSDADPARLYSPVIDADAYNPQQVNVESQIDDSGSLLNTIRNMVNVRKQHLSFSWRKFEWVDAGNDSILAYLRSHGDEVLLIVNNLLGESQQVDIGVPHSPAERPLDILNGEPVPSAVDQRLKLDLPPYGYRWLKLQ
jgi:maltose alpha-D-glucosyltransferase/alpha-amylase